MKIWQNYDHEFVASRFGPHCSVVNLQRLGAAIAAASATTDRFAFGAWTVPAPLGTR